MSRSSSDSLLPLNEVAKRLPGPVTARKLYRWIRCGVRGVHLDATLLGHSLFTSRAAIERFLNQLESTITDTRDGAVLLEEAGL